MSKAVNLLGQKLKEITGQ